MLKQQSPIDILAGLILLGCLVWLILDNLGRDKETSTDNGNQDNQEPDSEYNPVVSTANEIKPESTLPIELDSSTQGTEEQRDEQSSPSDRVKGEIKDGVELRALDDYPVEIRRFQIPKQGLTEAECEDKSALSSSEGRLRVAVADGATESLFSDIWAELIVNSYIEKGAELFNIGSLQSLTQAFLHTASKLILQMPETRHWFMYEKLERGSHATFVAAEFYNPETMEVLAVGDSCIFWRNEENGNVEMLPELSAEDFGVFPASICSLQKTWQNLESKIVKQEVNLQNGFQVILCTDALACWLVKELKKDLFIWEKLFKLSDSISFTNFIESLRSQKEIRNDDVTLVLIHAIPINVRLQ
ncbi:protein phosphatase 2C domain-containing protein [Oscillatoria sp. HE19RPO]|uniref:protein phosphatase 2C domain-containing protein n=1 Tax=Oscillatoria sp. HE19RPO TaxID=2954806 RepID=UPI0020C44018|nr:protein phosphatase 2C domain-containing protein [Oscillatoria sp. HE19RPO]